MSTGVDFTNVTKCLNPKMRCCVKVHNDEEILLNNLKKRSCFDKRMTENDAMEEQPEQQIF